MIEVTKERVLLSQISAIYGGGQMWPGKPFESREEAASVCGIIAEHLLPGFTVGVNMVGHKFEAFIRPPARYNTSEHFATREAAFAACLSALSGCPL